jgi:hypothetical protein
MKAKFVNENVLSADKELFDKFKQIFFEVKNSDSTDPFYDLNQKLNRLNIVLYDHESYFETKDKDERREFSNVNMIPRLGITLCGFDSELNNIFILVNETFHKKIFQISDEELEDILDFMWVAFGHETIHMSQVKRMKTKQNPTFTNKEEYYGNKQEMMAMAWSFIQNMKMIGMTNNEIMDMLKNKINFNRQQTLLNLYKSLGEKQFKIFTKYVYAYLTND